MSFSKSQDFMHDIKQVRVLDLDSFFGLGGAVHIPNSDILRFPFS